MHLQQMKSKQFHKQSTLEPMARANSFHNIDHKRKELTSKKSNDDAHENHLYLANIVHQLLQIKPRTALINKSKRNQPNRPRMQTTGQQYYHQESNQKGKTKPINILHIFRDSRQHSQEQKRNTVKVEQIKYKLLEIDGRMRNGHTSRTKSSKSSTYISFETISVPQALRKKSKRITIPKIPKPQGEPSNPAQNEEVPPKTKLTINNLDQFVSVQDEQNTKYHNKIFKPSLKCKDGPTDPTKTDKIYQIVLEEKKVKKCKIDPKIPDFIKASLAGYEQDQQFRMTCDKIINKKPEQPTEQIKPKDQSHPHITVDLQKNKQDVQELRSGGESREELSGAKLKLTEKSKRRTTRIGDYIRSKKEENIQSDQPQPNRNKSRQKQKEKKRNEEGAQGICGWENADVLTVETLELQ